MRHINSSKNKLNSKKNYIFQPQLWFDSQQTKLVTEMSQPSCRIYDPYFDLTSQVRLPLYDQYFRGQCLGT